MPNTQIKVDYSMDLQKERIEEELNRLIPLKSGPYQKLFESARYALLGGGKRLRPLIALATTQILGGDLNIALTPCCTLEMIHSYSLIHDDLPCMDDDDFRRGKLSVHRKYQEGHAVLTGDFLLTYAFEILATQTQLTPLTRTELISKLAHHSGAEGMIGGQVMDLANEGEKLDLKTLQTLHKNKTAALITASVEFGGIIANANPAEMGFLRQFGENIGIAFQVIDDVLDVTASEAKHGRTIPSDVLNQKTTYVSLLGIEEAKRYAFNYYEKAIGSLTSIPYDTSILATLADSMIHRSC